MLFVVDIDSFPPGISDFLVGHQMSVRISVAIDSAEFGHTYDDYVSYSILILFRELQECVDFF